MQPRDSGFWRYKFVRLFTGASIYTVRQKVETILVPMLSPNIGLFQKLFHWHTQQ